MAYAAGSDGLMSAGIHPTRRALESGPWVNNPGLKGMSANSANSANIHQMTQHYHINPINLQYSTINLQSNNCFNGLQRSSKANRPGHIDCLKQIHSLTFSQVDESRRSRIMSIHGRRTRPWKSPTNLYHNMNRGFLEFLCNSITWNLELSSYHVDFRLWRLQAYVDNVHTC